MVAKEQEALASSPTDSWRAFWQGPSHDNMGSWARPNRRPCRHVSPESRTQGVFRPNLKNVLLKSGSIGAEHSSELAGVGQP